MSDKAVTGRTTNSSAEQGVVGERVETLTPGRSPIRAGSRSSTRAEWGPRPHRLVQAAKARETVRVVVRGVEVEGTLVYFPLPVEERLMKRHTRSGGKACVLVAGRHERVDPRLVVGVCGTPVEHPWNSGDNCNSSDLHPDVAAGSIDPQAHRAEVM